MFDLNGKTALVTGASGGIGGAIARRLHELTADNSNGELRARRFSDQLNCVPCSVRIDVHEIDRGLGQPGKEIRKNAAQRWL